MNLLLQEQKTNAYAHGEYLFPDTPIESMDKRTLVINMRNQVYLFTYHKWDREGVKSELKAEEKNKKRRVLQKAWYQKKKKLKERRKRYYSKHREMLIQKAKEYYRNKNRLELLKRSGD